MECPNCGRQNDKETECFYCGHKLTSPKKQAEGKTQKLKSIQFKKKKPPKQKSKNDAVDSDDAKKVLSGMEKLKNYSKTIAGFLALAIAIWTTLKYLDTTIVVKGLQGYFYTLLYSTILIWTISLPSIYTYKKWVSNTTGKSLHIYSTIYSSLWAILFVGGISYLSQDDIGKLFWFSTYWVLSIFIVEKYLVKGRMYFYLATSIGRSLIVLMFLTVAFVFKGTTDFYRIYASFTLLFITVLIATLLLMTKQKNNTIKSYRHVPIVMCIIYFVLSFAIYGYFKGLLSDLIGFYLLFLASDAFKTAFFAPDKDIREFCNVETMTDETEENWRDRL